MARGRYKIIDGSDVSGLKVNSTYGTARVAIWDSRGYESYIDTVPHANRVIEYDAQGNAKGEAATYRAATIAPLACEADAGLFFAFYGSATTIVRVQRLVISGLTLTAVAYPNINLGKYSTAPSSGTATTLTQVPLDSGFAAGSSALCVGYTVHPTIGTLVGTLGSRRILGQADTAAAGGQPIPNAEWDFRSVNGASAVVLRGATQGIGAKFAAAPASVLSLAIEVEWTESAT